MEPNDQDGQVSDSTVNEEVNKETTPQDQEEETPEGSGGEGDKKEERLYRVDGRDYTAEELYQKHLNLNADYTHKSQRLSEIERQREEALSREAAKSVTSKLDVPADIRQSILDIVIPEVEKKFSEYQETQSSRDRLKSAISELAKEWDGSDGRPKFDPTRDADVLYSRLRDPDNTVFDAKLRWELDHKAEIDDWKIKQALRKQKGTGMTERTGTIQDRKPSSKTPKTWEDASKATMEQLRNANS